MFTGFFIGLACGVVLGYVAGVMFCGMKKAQKEEDEEDKKEPGVVIPTPDELKKDPEEGKDKAEEAKGSE